VRTSALDRSDPGSALVERVGALAAAAGHCPDVDLRPGGVTVELFSGTWEQLSWRDVELAGQISGAARELGAEADPGRGQHVQVAIDDPYVARHVNSRLLVGLC
jgi:4a-hydroxytetrahydrobiopterin dehydratase